VPHVEDIIPLWTAEIVSWDVLILTMVSGWCCVCEVWTLLCCGSSVLRSRLKSAALQTQDVINR